MRRRSWFLICTLLVALCAVAGGAWVLWGNTAPSVPPADARRVAGIVRERPSFATDVARAQTLGAATGFPRAIYANDLIIGLPRTHGMNVTQVSRPLTHPYYWQLVYHLLDGRVSAGTLTTNATHR